MEFVGYMLVFAGLFFFFVSALGLIRMPEFFTRMHAGTKATTLGSFLTLCGASVLEPDWALKFMTLAVFILITNPLSSSVLARAVYKQKEESK